MKPHTEGKRMASSILQTRKECWFCGGRVGLEEHHIFAGMANRIITMAPNARSNMLIFFIFIVLCVGQ